MNQIKIGWGKREISMEGPLSIPGQFHMRVAERILDPLYATVLCVDGGAGQDHAILCSFDLISISLEFINAVKAAVAEARPEINTNAIVLGATHTHSSGSYWESRPTTPDGVPVIQGTEFMAHLVKRTVEAICEAWDTRSEAGIGYGYGYAVVGHSRRTIYLDDLGLRGGVNYAAPNGHGSMYGNTKDSMFSHYEAGADHFLNLMFTFDAEQKLTGIVVNVPCPSQLSEQFTMISADFWHDVRQLVAKEYGKDVYVLTQCGCAGDLSPRTLHYKEAQARRMELKYGLSYDPKNMNAYNKVMAERYDIAERIVDGIKDVYSWAKKDIQTHIPVRHVRKDIDLDRRMITDEEKEWCEEGVADMEKRIEEAKNGPADKVRFNVSAFESFRNRNLRAIDRYKEQGKQPTLDYTVHVTQIGDIAFATNPFELYMDFQHRIQARSPFIQTFCVQLAGDGGACYLATQRGIENKGYSASLFCNLLSAEGGQQLVEETLKILNEMKAQDEA